VKKTVVPVPGDGFHPYRSAVAFDDAAHAGEADAGALEAVAFVELLEGLEQPGGVLHVESDAVVGDVEQVFVAVGASAHLDQRGVAVPRVNFQAFPIRFSRALRISAASASAVRSGSTWLCTTLPALVAASSSRISRAMALTSVFRCAACGGIRWPAFVSSSISSAHAQAGATQPRQIALPGFIKAVAIVFGQGMGKPVDCAQGRAQIVGHRVAEAEQLAV
jgi:hypothetical protein